MIAARGGVRGCDPGRAWERRSIVLVGMMGVGKSSIGRRLGARLGVPFVDADAEIEKAAGTTIADIFARHGEAAFRSGEARVIARLLEGGPQVLATGGGAVMNADTRAAIKAKGVSIWLHAEIRRADPPDQQAQERPADAADPRSGGNAAANCWPNANRSMRRPISPYSRAKCRTMRSSPRS